MSVPPQDVLANREVEQLERLIRRLADRIPEYPYQLALTARLCAQLEKRMAETANEVLRPLQLTYVLYQSMMIIHGGENGVIAPTEIAELTGERPNNVTHICNHLEKQGYITRTHNPVDRRRVEVSLTAAGRRLLGKAQPLIWAAWHRRFAGFSSKELALLPQLLKRQILNLDSPAGPAP
ncbi:MAG TPA: MarR family transcriptional regulator [Steroidobacteraceae bacterium]|nr:MarR family transcriptional regulator [Steroidobacteraceae bacterium]